MIVNKIKNIFYKLIYYFRIQYGLLLFNKRVILIGTPWYGNLGDHAITIGEKYILKKSFPDYKLIDIPYNIYFSKITRLFGLHIKDSDRIFLQGGGNLGSLYPREEILRRDVIKKYKHNKIVIMPVSIFFHNDNFGRNELKKSQAIYNIHKDLTILSRDEVSYDFAKKHFDRVNNVLAPDAATSLDGIISDKKFVRNGVQFFLRKDIEKILPYSVIDSLKEYIQLQGISFNISDTIVDHEVIEKDRKNEVFNKLYLAKKSRLVITDRYHGLIFSVITHTPVIVFKSFDTKISSGVKWFKDLDWVHYVDSKDTNKITYLIDKYCKGEEYSIKNYSSCKDIIINKMKFLAVEKSDR